LSNSASKAWNSTLNPLSPPAIFIHSALEHRDFGIVVRSFAPDLLFSVGRNAGPEEYPGDRSSLEFHDAILDRLCRRAWDCSRSAAARRDSVRSAELAH
jgi:hypothetical protein